MTNEAAETDFIYGPGLPLAKLVSFALPVTVAGLCWMPLTKLYPNLVEYGVGMALLFGIPIFLVYRPLLKVLSRFLAGRLRVSPEGLTLGKFQLPWSQVTSAATGQAIDAFDPLMRPSAGPRNPVEAVAAGTLVAAASDNWTLALRSGGQIRLKLLGQSFDDAKKAESVLAQSLRTYLRLNPGSFKNDWAEEVAPSPRSLA